MNKKYFNLILDAESKPYWDAAKKKKLLIQRCMDTGKCFLYSRRLQNISISDNYEWIESEGKGTIYSFTIVFSAAGEYYADKVPYVVASINLTEGARIITNILTDRPKDIKINDEVYVVFDKVSDEITMPRFKLRSFN